jgi:hypothetical protein
MNTEDMRETGTGADSCIAQRAHYEPDTRSLIERAVDRGVTAAELKELAALQEWSDRRAAFKAYNLAMNACQSKLPSVLKNATNDHTNKKYATLDAIQALCTPVITEHGFSLSFGSSAPRIEGHLLLWMDIRHRDGHVERIEGDIPLDGTGAKGGKSSMNATQATGSTYSYGQRYLMKMGFNLRLAGEDTDGVYTKARISAEHIGELEELMKDCAAAGKPIILPKWFKWLCNDEEAGWDSVLDAKFEEARDFLKKRKGEGKK